MLIVRGQRCHSFEVSAGAASAGEQSLDPRYDAALLGEGGSGSSTARRAPWPMLRIES
jgi:hypothetical protein